MATTNHKFSLTLPDGFLRKRVNTNISSSMTLESV